MDYTEARHSHSVRLLQSQGTVHCTQKGLPVRKRLHLLSRSPKASGLVSSAAQFFPLFSANRRESSDLTCSPRGCTVLGSQAVTTVFSLGAERPSLPLSKSKKPFPEGPSHLASARSGPQPAPELLTGKEHPVCPCVGHVPTRPRGGGRASGQMWACPHIPVDCLWGWGPLLSPCTCYCSGTPRGRRHTAMGRACLLLSDRHGFKFRLVIYLESH